MSNLIFSQIEKSDTETNYEFRQISGKLISSFGEPIPAQTVMIVGTQIGTQTDLNGNFCIIVPEGLTIYIEFPLLNYNTFREIKPDDKTIELKAGKGKQKSKKAWRNYKKIKVELNTELNKVYNSEEYKNEKNICG